MNKQAIGDFWQSQDSISYGSNSSHIGAADRKAMQDFYQQMSGQRDKRDDVIADLDKALNEMISENLSLALTSSNPTIRFKAETLERARKRQEAIESAKAKLSPEEIEALGLK